MPDSESSFYAKILLFGEYSLMAGSGALTIPFKNYCGSLRFFHEFPGETPAASLRSNQELNRYYVFLDDGGTQDPAIPIARTTAEKPGNLFADHLRLEELKKDLDDGLFFDSSIPSGYGAGSSGALVAALFKRYAKLPLSDIRLLSVEELGSLKRLFAAMESYFHGTSSGIDPLSCYVKRPLFFSHSGIIRLVSPEAFPAKFSGGFFLLDTGTIGKTGPLVKGFIKKCRQKVFSDFLWNEYSPVVDRCIGAWLENDPGKLFREVQILSDYQLIHFREMIPPSFIPLWHIGKESGAFVLKLCGSGGGGFLLGFAGDYETAKRYIAPLGLIKV